MKNYLIFKCMISPLYENITSTKEEIEYTKKSINEFINDTSGYCDFYKTRLENLIIELNETEKLIKEIETNDQLNLKS